MMFVVISFRAESPDDKEMKTLTRRVPLRWCAVHPSEIYLFGTEAETTSGIRGLLHRH